MVSSDVQNSGGSKSNRDITSDGGVDVRSSVGVKLSRDQGIKGLPGLEIFPESVVDTRMGLVAVPIWVS